MATGQAMTNEGLNGMLDRISKSSPDVSAFNQFVIGTGTDTPESTDTFATFENVPSGFPKDVISGYPIFDAANKRMTMRGFVASAEANGITVSEAGITNTDSTEKALNRDVHTEITKTSTQTISYAFIYELSG